MDSFEHAAQKNGRTALAALVWSVANAVLTTGLTAIVFAVTSHILSPADFGAVAFSASLVAIASILVPLAFNEALVQRSSLDPAHLDTVFWTGLLIALGVWGCLSFGSGYMADLFGIETVAAILPVLGARIVFDALGGVPNALILRKMAFRQIAIRTSVAHGASALLCLGLVWQGYAFWALVLSQLAGAVIQALFSLWICGWRPGRNLSYRAFRDLRRFGFFTMGRRALDTAKLDQFLLGAVLGAPVLGLYFFALRLNEMIQQVTTAAVSQVFGVSFAALQTDLTKLREIYLKSCFAAAAISFPTFAGLIATAPDLVPIIFGAQWGEAVFAVQALAAVALVASIGNMQAALIQSVGQAGWWFTYRVAVQLAGFAIILAMAPLGLNAVVTGLVLRIAILWPMSLWRALRIIDTGLAQFADVLRSPALAAAGMVAVLGGVRAVLPDAFPPVWSCLALIGSGAASYIMILTYLARDQIGPVWKSIRHARKEQAV